MPISSFSTGANFKGCFIQHLKDFRHRMHVPFHFHDSERMYDVFLDIPFVHIPFQPSSTNTGGLLERKGSRNLQGQGFPTVRRQATVSARTFGSPNGYDRRHGSPAAGHSGIHRTASLISAEFGWPSLSSDVRRYVTSCDLCQRTKLVIHAPYGTFLPPPVPQRNWSSISVDFLTKLPPSNGFTMVIVFVDRRSKRAHFIPTSEDLDGVDFAQIFMEEVFKLHGLPDQMISDRGPQFVNAFISRLCELLDIESSPSTAFHQRTNGQAERTIETFEAYLRCYSSYLQDESSCLSSLCTVSTGTVSRSFDNITQDRFYNAHADHGGSHAAAVVYIYANLLGLCSSDRSEVLFHHATLLRQSRDRSKERLAIRGLRDSNAIWSSSGDRHPKAPQEPCGRGAAHSLWTAPLRLWIGLAKKPASSAYGKLVQRFENVVGAGHAYLTNENIIEETVYPKGESAFPGSTCPLNESLTALDYRNG